MTYKRQSDALRLAGIADDGPWTYVIGVRKQIAAELHRQSAEIETLRTGYEAARLEIESLRASHGQAPAQPEVVPECHYGPLRDADAEWGKQLSVYATLPRAADTQQAPAGEGLRTDALCDLSYSHGLKAGWNYCASDDLAGFERAQKIGTEALRTLKSTTAQAAPAAVAGPSDPSITLDFKQATELLKMFGGEPGLVTLQHGNERSHSGAGLYAWYSDLPEEGAVFLGAEPDDEAAPTTQPAPQQEAQEPAAWMTQEGDRVVTEKTMNAARRDGGAMLTSLRSYSVALVRAAAPQPSPAVQGDALDAACQRACMELPEGMSMAIQLERHAGWIELHDSDGEQIELPNADGSLAEQMHEAVNAARARLEEKP